MQAQEVREPVQTTNIGGIGEDRGGIPVIAGMSFLMVAIVLFALGYLFFTAPSAGTGSHIRDSYREQPVTMQDTREVK
ncbi:MAG: hypothetical protein SGJ27_13670 [Candidatus Melainabacteria bacterium]|nr:hypothetical protein [Candidatus Melainabacteria bacterium]